MEEEVQISRPPLVYNPNSVDAQFALLHAAISANSTMSAQILVQTTKTNGRVTTLEKDVSKLEKQMEGRWKYLTGGAAAVALFGGGVYALLHFLMP